jgi:hypothetical protein
MEKFTLRVLLSPSRISKPCFDGLRGKTSLGRTSVHTSRRWIGTCAEHILECLFLCSGDGCSSCVESVIMLRGVRGISLAI